MSLVASGQSATSEQSAVRGAGEYLSFRLGAEHYGIDILKVQEIRGYERSMRMVRAPRHVLGVLNLRGVIVPIVDLRIRFGLSKPVYDGHTVTIVLKICDRFVGLVVDTVSDVVALMPSEIRPAPDFEGAIGASHVIGVAAVAQEDRERMLILLDIENLMDCHAMGMPDTSLL